MRIAVLVFGRLNKCDEHYDNFMDSIGRENAVDFFLSSDNSKESLLNDFIRLYKPVSYNNDEIQYDCDVEKYPGIRGETNIPNMIRHFINKHRVFALFEEYIKKDCVQYDAVLSVRIDLVFNNHFDFQNLEDNTIYIPEGFDFLEYAINDQVAHGKVDVMKKYSLLYSNMIYFLDNRLSIPHPESLTYANICYNGIIVKRTNLSYRIEK